MRPIFTVHAGEFLVGQHLESFKNRNVWVPTKEHDVDLLVTDKANKKAVSLQVKFSKDFLPTLNAESTVIAGLQACTWFAFDRARLAKSTADLWVLVLPRFAERKNDFLVMPPKELLAKLDALHPGTKKFQVYVWVTKAQRAWLARGITRAIETEISNGTYQHTGRDVTAALNDWSHI